MSEIPGQRDMLCPTSKGRFVPCTDGSGLARTFFTYAGLGQCSHVFGL
jgi:hypothetical protein